MDRLGRPRRGTVPEGEIDHLIPPPLYGLPLPVWGVLAVGLLLAGTVGKGLATDHYQRVGEVEIDGLGLAVAAAGDYLYVASEGEALQVISVARPEAPVEIANLTLPGVERGLALAGDYLYAASGTEGLHVVEVSDPHRPTIVGSLKLMPNRDARDVTVAGDRAFVAAGTGLVVADVSDPVAPAELGAVDLPGHAMAVAVAGDYAFVSAAASGVRIVDVSDPQTPREVANVALPQAERTIVQTYGMALAGDFALVALGKLGVQVIDVSDPLHPEVVGFYDSPHQDLFETRFSTSARDVAVQGNLAYVAYGLYGLRVIEIKESGAVREMGHESEERAWLVAVSGSSVFVVTNNKLAVVPLDGDGDGYPTGSDAYPRVAWLHAGWQGALMVLALTPPLAVLTNGFCRRLARKDAWRLYAQAGGLPSSPPQAPPCPAPTPALVPGPAPNGTPRHKTRPMRLRRRARIPRDRRVARAVRRTHRFQSRCYRARGRDGTASRARSSGSIRRRSALAAASASPGRTRKGRIQ